MSGLLKFFVTLLLIVFIAGFLLGIWVGLRAGGPEAAVVAAALSGAVR